MTHVSAAGLAVIAAMISMAAAAASLYVMRAGQRGSALPHDIGELEQAIEDLVQRLEVAAGRCIHDLESREAQVRKLLAGEGAPDPCEPPGAADATSQPAEGLAQDESQPSARYFGTDLVSRSAEACELAERDADEATICRVTGLQRGELRLLLALRTAQHKAA